MRIRPVKLKNLKHLAGNTGPKMAFAFDGKSIKGKTIVHMVQFSSLVVEDGLFDGTTFSIIASETDKRIDLLAECVTKDENPPK